MNTQKITEKFLNEGWENISFTEIEEDGKQLFVMNESGNIYTADGKIYRYNIKTCI